MAKGPEEWFTQAEYDMSAADYMFWWKIFLCRVPMSSINRKGIEGTLSEKVDFRTPKGTQPDIPVE